MNHEGVAVGNATHPWRYAGGKVTQLADPDGGTARVMAVNSGGDILGARYFGEDESKAVPVLWPADALDEPRDLIKADPAERIDAVDLGDDGTAVLAKWTGEPWPALLVRRSDGEMSRLGEPDGHLGPVRIRGGQVLESRDDPADNYESGPLRLWDLSTGTAKEYGSKVHGEGLTADGVIAGWIGREYDGTPGVTPEARAVLVRDDALVELPQPEGAIATDTTAIADDGTIVGTATNTDWRSSYGVIWRGC